MDFTQFVYVGALLFLPCKPLDYGNYNTEYNALMEEQEANSAADSAADSASDSAAAPEVDFDKVKEDTKNQIAEIKLAYAKATEAGVTLSKADRDAINAEIESLKSSVSQQGISYADYLSIMNSDAETVKQIIEEQYMGNMYYATFAKDKYVTAKHILIEYGDEDGSFYSDLEHEIMPTNTTTLSKTYAHTKACFATSSFAPLQPAN